MSIIFGLIGMVIGALIVIKSEKVFNFFGRIEFFDRYLGTEGGSRLGYKLVGLLIFFISLLAATGLISGFMKWVLSPLLRYSQPPQQYR